MKKVLTFGVFDYFHIGHLNLFEQCKEFGDYLIIGLQNGEYIKKFKPDASVLYSTEERVRLLKALKIVDEVITYNELNTTVISSIDFDVFALGEDHIGERFDRLVQWCEENDKTVVRLKRTQGISSSSIKERLNAELK